MFIHNSIKRWILLLLIGCKITVPSEINAQGKINIGLGIKLWESYNISVRYQGDQTQYALEIGGLKNEFKNNIGISAIIFYHFDGVSKYTSRRPWYGKVTLNYRKYKFENSISTQNNYSVGLNVGRDFNLSKRLAFNSDVGFNFKMIGVLAAELSAGIWIFYRI